MEQLDWLPKHPDLRGAIKAARSEVDPQQRLVALAGLAAFNRDFVLTERLDRLVGECLDALGGWRGAPALTLSPARLAVLSSHTVDHLLPAIRIAGLQRRLALTVHVTPYALYRQALLAGDTALDAFAPQFVLLALDAHDLAVEVPLEADEATAAAAVGARVEELRRLWRIARERYTAQVIQQTLLPVSPPVFGSYEGLVPGAPGAILARLNAAIRSAAAAEGVLLLDLAWHGATMHREALADPVRWHQAKQLVSPLIAPLYGDWLARIVAAARGLSRKCLVLDLDNTLWGGVVGDDGVEGIQLGQGSPAGEAFLAFQRYVALLAQRGIVLAVCSKNDATIAEAAFSSHPEMALRRADIAVFQANWEDKAGNLRRIAQTLALGTDSLVFVDDNPAERDIVRRELPEVAVPELPDDVAFYPARLSAGGYFEAVSFTGDDVARSRSYALNAERREALEQATDMEGYLRSLAMTMLVAPVGPVDLPRAAQLINKSNQFNLTTRRYTEAELSQASADEATLVRCFRLRDRFGDNGLISVILLRPDPAWDAATLLIDTWLMSCRVLGRQVEAASLEVLAKAAAQCGATALIGSYRPTAKNRLVEDHYAKLGFVPCDAPANALPDETFWRFDLQAATLPTHHIHIESA